MGKVVRVDLSTLWPLLLLSYGHHLTLHLPHPGTSLWPLLLAFSSLTLLSPGQATPYLAILYLVSPPSHSAVPHSGGAGGGGEDNLLLHFGSQSSSLLRPTPFSSVLALTIKYLCHCLGHSLDLIGKLYPLG
ncbi:hypothetical protein DL96DRAFT_1654590 [Flagelloscypha sp. PMI_526]|nr:hypothetical protein DL96DRAFT_1654590 [Flagelloscypha sp. PMI_526]